jgi:signal transduction histidine kinase
MSDAWQQRFERERAARREAEQLLHEKSRDLYAANLSLEARAAELSASLDTLRDTQDQLVEREKLAALGALVAGVAHEINTPVGVAVTAVSHAGDRVRALDRDLQAGTLTRGGMRAYVADVQEALDLALANLERGARLVTSFKMVAVDQSSETPRHAVVENLIADVVASLRPVTRRASVQVEVHAAGRTSVIVDAGAVSQIVTNLVQNACVHAFAETTGDRVVDIRVDTEGRHIVLVVSDNGRGMPDEVASRVFEPFFTTERARGGSGLGMHIVHTLVTQRFLGTIDLQTAPGQGARWSLRLPFGTNALHPVQEAILAADP